MADVHDSLLRKLHARVVHYLFPTEHDAWAFFSVASRLVCRLLVVVLLLRALEPADMAMWYLFGAIFGIVALIDAGLGRAVTRHVAELVQDQDANRARTYGAGDFLSTATPFYAAAVAVVSASAFTAGAYWLTKQGYGLTESYLVAWAVYALAGGFALYAAFLASALAGLQKLALASRNDVVGAAANAAMVAIFTLILSGVLLATLALLLSSALVLLLQAWSLRRSLQGLARSNNEGTVLATGLKMLRGIGPDAARMLLMLFAYQCLTSGFVLVIAAYESPSVVASYGATVQLIYIVISLSNAWSVAGFPMLSASNGNPGELKAVFWPRCTRSISVAVSGMLAIMTLGPLALDTIGSRTTFLEPSVTALLCTAVLLEFIVGQFTNLLLSQGTRLIAELNAIAAILALIAAASLLHFDFSLEVIIAVRILLLLSVVAFLTLSRSLSLLSGTTA